MSSEVTTMLAWLIPCLVIVLGVIAYRVYIYKTRGPFVPSYLQRNIFARTRSFLPRTLSFNKTPDSGPMGGTATASAEVPATALRNETRIDMTHSSISQPPQSMTTISHPTVSPSSLSSPGGNPPSISKPPVSPAISRLLSMS